MFASCLNVVLVVLFYQSVHARVPFDEPLGRALDRVAVRYKDDGLLRENLARMSREIYATGLDATPAREFMTEEFLTHARHWGVGVRRKFRAYMARAGLPTGLSAQEMTLLEANPSHPLFTLMDGVYALPVDVHRRHEAFFVIDFARVFASDEPHPLKSGGWKKDLRAALDRHLAVGAPEAVPPVPRKRRKRPKSLDRCKAALLPFSIEEIEAVLAWMKERENKI